MKPLKTSSTPIQIMKREDSMPKLNNDDDHSPIPSRMMNEKSNNHCFNMDNSFEDKDNVNHWNDTIDDNDQLNQSQDFSFSYNSENQKAKKVNLNDFQILRLVGQGGFGKVFQVQHKESKKIYAMKAFKKKFLIEKNCVDGTFAERNILQYLSFPFIVSLHYAFQTSGRVYIVMDWINGGQILFHLNNEKKFLEDDVKIWASELLLGLEKLHSIGIIHRDLKPENILLDSEGHIVITDFGLAKDNVHLDNEASTFCGTVEYLAPEVLKGNSYGKPSDCWSFGALVYDLLTGHPPFEHKNEKRLREMIINSKIKLLSYLSSDCHSFLKQTLVKEPNKRLDVKAIKQHPWFKGVDWDLVLQKKCRIPIKPEIKSDLDVSYFEDEFRHNVVGFSVEEHLSKSQDQLFKDFTFCGRGENPLLSQRN
eukprot:TRINITY_DN13592_c0_g1_i1.p1 TRINITY_DN13592_c0_g1~~TRINITY_DN13592_c0_g1_i1.p1  ORF type:complete len:422 (+),score=134.69 TRINITY_DN13592_c0_g1_i1:1466-2731(+)